MFIAYSPDRLPSCNLHAHAFLIVSAPFPVLFCLLFTLSSLGCTPSSCSLFAHQFPLPLNPWSRAHDPALLYTICTSFHHPKLSSTLLVLITSSCFHHLHQFICSTSSSSYSASCQLQVHWLRSVSSLMLMPSDLNKSKPHLLPIGGQGECIQILGIDPSYIVCTWVILILNTSSCCAISKCQPISDHA